MTLQEKLAGATRERDTAAAALRDYYLSNLHNQDVRDFLTTRLERVADHVSVYTRELEATFSPVRSDRLEAIYAEADAQNAELSGRSVAEVSAEADDFLSGDLKDHVDPYSDDCNPDSPRLNWQI